MIRPITFITALMFVVSGAYLFAVKHRSQTLDDQLTMTAQATRLDAQRIRVLQAQWALEVDPSRLAQLSTQFITTLQPMKPSQLITLATLTNMLPSPGSPVPGSNPEDAIPVMPQVPAVADASVASAASPAHPAPVQVASAAAASASVVAADVTQVAPPHADAAVRSPVRVASAAFRPRSQLASVEGLLHSLPQTRRARHRHPALNREYAENRPSYEGSALAQPPQMSSGLAPQAPMGAQVMSVRAVAAPPPAPMDDGGSMLGMAQGGGN